MKTKKHPIQPIVWQDGVIRFKENKLVSMLLQHSTIAGMGLNQLVALTRCNTEFDDDWNQLAQLIGYSVSGFGDLSYADKKLVKKADKIADKMFEEKENKTKDNE